MIRVMLKGPGGQEYRLDTPDPAMIGGWIKAVMDTYSPPDPKSGYRIPVQFTITIE